MLECYRDYLIAQNNRATATRLAKLMKGHINHGKVPRFLLKVLFFENFNGPKIIHFIDFKQALRL